MIYFKYKKFIQILKYIRKRNNLDHLEWDLDEKFGSYSKEVYSVLEARGGLRRQGISFHLIKDTSIIDSLILEYKEKCSAMYWEFVKWTIGTAIAVAGLYIAYLSFVKS